MSIPVDTTLDLQNTNKIINSAAPSAAGDLVTKAYADAIAQGIIFKQAVVAASVGANVVLTAPGANLDGVALVAGNRVLLMSQTTASQNGLWVWNGAAVPMTRPTDFATGATEPAGTTVFVEQGTANIDLLYTLITPAGAVVDTGVQAWTQTNGAAEVTVSAPLVKTGNNISIPNPLPVANGGTGAATAAGARTALGAVGKFATTVGDGATLTFNVAHNLGTLDVQVEVLDMATGNYELTGFAVTGVNNVSVTFGVAPAAAGGAVGSGTGKRIIVVG